ncbi:MAG: hypothetical protein ABIO85_10060 [Sphingomicrobium sp.]
MRQWPSRPDEDEIERACRGVLFSHIRDDLREAERSLLSAERDGSVNPVYDGLPPIDAAQCRSVFLPTAPDNIEKVSATKRPAHRPPKRPEVLRIFRERVAAGQNKQDRAQESRAILNTWSTQNKPTQKTVSAFLEPFYRSAVWCDGKLLDADALLERIDGDKVDKEPT